MQTNVSVTICSKGADKYIGKCISMLLDQTFKDFEIIIVEDPPFDRTKHIINTFEGKKIRYIRNQKHLGLSKSRNRCVELAEGNYIFFTDADCIVSKNWIEEGQKCFREQDCIGVEGKTYYVSEEYKPTYSDHIIENKNGGQFMTCNMAYKKSVFDRIGGFDKRYTYLEDRDLAMRAIKLGRICFNPKMIVYHQKTTLTPKQFVQTGKRLRNRVLLYKKFKDKPNFIWRIVDPLDLIAMIFPPLTFGSFFRNRYRTKEDFDLFPFIYVRIIYERLNFWDMCARERVFLI